MGICQLCNKKTLFFRKYHKKCELIDNSRKKQIELLTNIQDEIEDNIKDIINEEMSTNILQEKIDKISEIEKTNYPEVSDFISSFILYSFSRNSKLDDSKLSEIIEKYVILTQELVIDKSTPCFIKLLDKLVRTGTICSLNLGLVPEYKLIESSPVILTKNEYIVWIEQNSELNTYKTKTEYVGGSSGVSVRLFKGVSLRSNSYKGKPVTQEYLKPITTGIFVITTKNIIFSSEISSKKIPLSKISDINSYTDGIKIHPSNTQKPFVITGFDGNFTKDIILKLIQLSVEK